MPKFSIYELDRLFSEKQSERVALTCLKHNYVAAWGSPPTTTGCANCWMAFYVADLAGTPPHLRQERLEQLEAAVHHSIEAEARGEWDVRLFEHPEIKIEKDAEPD